MRSTLEKLLDTWGDLSAPNQFGIAFVFAVVLIAILVLAF